MEHRLYMNQLGYKPHGLKAFTSTIEGAFEVIDPATGTVILSGNTSPLLHDASSGQAIAKGDFSAVNTPGHYRINLQGIQEDFVVTEQPYSEIKQALLKNFYYQRCGMALEEVFAGVWTHGACHLAKARVHGTDEWRTIHGGWHDAGDYGRYTVPAAKAVADLLLAYEWFPEAFAEPINIPNETEWPDLLIEVKYELDFLFAMQREDGACYHKVTTAQFPPLDRMPEDDLDELIISPISLTATAAFAAVMAMSARVYHELDNEYAKRCKQAALSAWDWLEQTTFNEGFHNPQDIHTGVYGDDTWLDEIYWLNAELYRLTEEQRFLEKVELTLKTGGFPLCELGWADTGGYGTLCLLSTNQELLSPSLLTMLQNTWQQEANTYVTQCSIDGFDISLLPEHYVWGSNMVVMNRAMLLITAGQLFDNDQFLQAAADHWHYLLGRNITGYCFVTGFGRKPVNNIHHRPSIADGIEAQVPGIVSGGPNYRIQDEVASAKLQGRAPAASFIDHIGSYATNEMTIYWNSPAVFVAAFADQF